MSINLAAQDPAMGTPIDRVSSGLAVKKEGIEDTRVVRTQSSSVESLKGPRSSCLSKALQRERGAEQRVDRKTVRRQMLSELDGPTKENILRAKHSGKPCVVEGGLYLISTSETPEGKAKLGRIASARSIHPEQLQHVPEYTWSKPYTILSPDSLR